MAGEPATFFTRSEVSWKARLAEKLGGFRVRPNCGIKLEFIVSAWKRRGHHFDLDNLAKPVFDVLEKPQVEFVDIFVKQGADPGVWIQVSDEWPPVLRAGSFWLRRLLVGSQKHEGVHHSLRSLPPLAGDFPLCVRLLFYEPVLLTDFGFEGSVKPTLDRLWPIIGGTSSRPGDYRIRHLSAQYSDQRMTGVGVAIEELEGGLN